MSPPEMRTPLGRVVLVSLEKWDQVWRRNQHLAARLLALGLADHVTFVNPAEPRAARAHEPVPGINVVTLRRRFPKRLGGMRLVATSIQRMAKQIGCDTLWVNDANAGAWVSGAWRVVYDVTDDWRSAGFTKRELRRIIASEDRLARQAQTVVCSEELRQRWLKRYGVNAEVVPNAVDVHSIQHAQPIDLGPDYPQVGYVGTLHDERLDVDLVLTTADLLDAGRVHLVGPDCLSDASRSRLLAHSRITVHGPVPAVDVPSWLVSFDVLICPHRVTSFTLSLDAIKAYEYLATTKPIVATPTSGFQNRSAEGLVVTVDGFEGSVSSAAQAALSFQRSVPDWEMRTRQFVAAVCGPRSSSPIASNP